MPKDADFGKPLGAHDEVSLIPVSSDGRGGIYLVKGDVEANGLSGRERFGKGDLHHRVVVLIAIVGRSEAHALGEVSIALGGDAIDLDGALLCLRVGDVGAVLYATPWQRSIGAGKR